MNRNIRSNWSIFFSKWRNTLRHLYFQWLRHNYLLVRASWPITRQRSVGSGSYVRPSKVHYATEISTYQRRLNYSVFVFCRLQLSNYKFANWDEMNKNSASQRAFGFTKMLGRARISVKKDSSIEHWSFLSPFGCLEFSFFNCKYLQGKLGANFPHWRW